MSIRSDSEVFLILHGTGGNTPGHWQDHLADALRAEGKDVRYPRLPDASTPTLAKWMPALVKAMAGIEVDARLTVVCHSRACILWMHYAEMGARRLRAERVLLVAPPYVASEPVSDWMFFPPPLSADGIASAAVSTSIIASDDDEFATVEEASTYAEALSIPIYLLPNSGHISPFYGYGEWPWVVDWCLRLADFPPVSLFP